MPGRRSEVIPPDRCLELLRSQVLGRVVWSSAGRIQVLPVTYTLREPDLLFRTGSDSPLAELSERHQVAIEVDRFDTESRSGWSVVVHGLSWATSDADDLVELWRATDPVPWAPGIRTQVIATALHRVTGRIVGGV